jgi:RNA 2',3'-cyclic 3'-phosphodiesterase
LISCAAICSGWAEDVARLFVAVWPPDDVLDQLESLPRLPLAGARWTTRSQWHVTLRFLGSTEPAAAAAALEDVVAQPSVAELGPRPVRLGRSVLMVPVGGLDHVAAAVERATAHIGQPPDDRPFRGHLTLARSRTGTAPRLDAELQASWPVAEVTLVASHPHPAGSRYEMLHTVALDVRRTRRRAGRR